MYGHSVLSNTKEVIHAKDEKLEIPEFFNHKFSFPISVETFFSEKLVKIKENNRLSVIFELNT